VPRVLLVLVVLLAGCTSHRTQQSQTLRLTYDVVDAQGQHTTQVIDLQRPYRARTTTFSGKQSLGGFLWDETGTYTVSPDGAIAQTAAIGPGFPGPASDLALALPVAERQHLVRRKGVTSSGGRPCTIWQSFAPLDGAPFSPPNLEATESCVDAKGVILSEHWVSDTGPIRTRTLLSTGNGPSDLYDGKHPQPPPSGNAATVAKPSTAAELSRLLGIPVPAGPVGLTADRAAAVLDIDSARRGVSREAGVMTWVGGGHLAVLRIERDLVAGGGRSVRGEAIQLGTLGTAHLEPVLAGLRVQAGGPRGLRVIATADLPEAQLLGWLRSLSL
jgi:hypothetical protein